MIRKFQPKDARELLSALKADDAECVAPTHVLVEEGHIVGYGSAGKVGLLAGWTAPTVSDADSADCLKTMEQHARAAGVQTAVIVCTEQCRFKRLMAEAGYTEGKQVTIYFKRLKHG